MLVLLIVSGRRYTDVLLRARRAQPLSEAAEAQWDLLPPLSYTGSALAVSGILEPAYSIGGDSFDYAVKPGRLEFADHRRDRARSARRADGISGSQLAAQFTPSATDAGSGVPAGRSTDRRPVRSLLLRDRPDRLARQPWPSDVAERRPRAPAARWTARLSVNSLVDLRCRSVLVGRWWRSRSSNCNPAIVSCSIPTVWSNPDRQTALCSARSVSPTCWSVPPSTGCRLPKRCDGCPRASSAMSEPDCVTMQRCSSSSTAANPDPATPPNCLSESAPASAARSRRCRDSGPPHMPVRPPDVRGRGGRRSRYGHGDGGGCRRVRPGRTPTPMFRTTDQGYSADCERSSHSRTHQSTLLDCQGRRVGWARVR